MGLGFCIRLSSDACKGYNLLKTRDGLEKRFFGLSFWHIVAAAKCGLGVSDDMERCLSLVSVPFQHP